VEDFTKRFEQPIVLAAEFEMPKLIEILLANGADPSTSVTEAYRTNSIYYGDCRNVLEIVQKKLVELREWDVSKEHGMPQLGGKCGMLWEAKKTAIDALIAEYESAEGILARATGKAERSDVVVLKGNVQTLAVTRTSSGDQTASVEREPQSSTESPGESDSLL